MKIPVFHLSLAIALGVLLVFSGCGKKGGSPEPITSDRAATELTQAFARAKPELKEIAGRAAAALQATNYPEASALLTQLSRAPGLSEQERDVAGRAMIGVNQLLQEAQAKGDQKSAEYLRRLQQAR